MPVAYSNSDFRMKHFNRFCSICKCAVWNDNSIIIRLSYIPSDQWKGYKSDFTINFALSTSSVKIFVGSTIRIQFSSITLGFKKGHTTYNETFFCNKRPHNPAKVWRNMSAYKRQRQTFQRSNIWPILPF